MSGNFAVPIGIGVDIVRNARLLSLFRKPAGERFIAKAFHPLEIERIRALNEDEKNLAEFLGSRWAAKEALVKASRKKELDFAAVRISKNADGSPYFDFDPKADRLLRELGMTRSFLSLSHEDEYSIATVMLY